MSHWSEVMPTIDKMDVITGTPVRFVKGDEVAGFPLRHDMSLTVRPWGDENDKYCMVIDDKGTSVPCPMESLVIDLEHPLGLAAAMQWLYSHGDWIEWVNTRGGASMATRCFTLTTKDCDIRELSELIREACGVWTASADEE